MAARFIIDDRTGELYTDFTARRNTTGGEVLNQERGLAPTVQVFSINVPTDGSAITGNTLTNANLSLAVGDPGAAPDAGFVKASFGSAEGAQIQVDHLTASAYETALNAIAGAQTAGGVACEDIAPGRFLVTATDVGVIADDPGFNVEGAVPVSAVEVTEIRTGDADTRAQWVVQIAQTPIASIAGGGWSITTSGSFSGFEASLDFSTAGAVASLARGVDEFALSIVHSSSLLYRGGIKLNESVDPSGAGSLVITTPSLFTLGATSVDLGDTVALSGLTYSGGTLTATGGSGDMTAAVYDAAGYAQQVATEARLASTANAQGASLVGIEDAGALITATTVEAALAEIKALVDTNTAKTTYPAASTVLTDIKTVDGTGSGLDADLLDGAELAALAQLASANTFTAEQRIDEGTHGEIKLGSAGGWSIIGTDGSLCELRYNSLGKVLISNGGVITSSGESVIGNITVTGTVDGRDIATDGTKLDGIEAAADVTDATNVAAAGAVMADGTGNDITGDVVFTEKADHSSTPAAGKGYLWVKNTAPATLMFTDDAGTDFTVNGVGGGDALTTNPLSQFAATTSAQLLGVISDETGTGALVFATSPTLVTPLLGTPTSGTLTNCTGLPIVAGTTGTLTVARGGTGVATSGTTSQIAVGGGTSSPIVWTTATGTGSPVRATSPTLVTPALGTPASGNLANCTALNATQLTSGTIPAARVGAAHIDALTEIAAALKAGTGAKLVTNGNDASVPIYTEKHAASHTISAAECYGGVHYVTAAATITLPAVAAGMSVTIITVGAVAVSVDPNASDLIMLEGTALDDGDKITNGSTSGDIAVLTYYDATGWYASTATAAGAAWTDGGP